MLQRVCVWCGNLYTYFLYNNHLFSFSQEPSWDTSSAFFARAAGRNPPTAPASNSTTVKNNTPIPNGQSTQTVKNGPSQPPPAEQIDPVVLRSRQVAGWYDCDIVQGCQVLSHQLLWSLDPWWSCFVSNLNQQRAGSYAAIQGCRQKPAASFFVWPLQWRWVGTWSLKLTKTQKPQEDFISLWLVTFPERLASSRLNDRPAITVVSRYGPYHPNTKWLCFLG